MCGPSNFYRAIIVFPQTPRGGVAHVSQKDVEEPSDLAEEDFEEIPDTDYFDVSLREGSVVPQPVTAAEHGSRLAAIRKKIHDLGIKSSDIGQAIQWARGRGRRRR